MDPQRTQAEPSWRVRFTYCTQCHWMLRAAWMAQELLSTFAAELREVALRPGPSLSSLLCCIRSGPAPGGETQPVCFVFSMTPVLLALYSNKRAGQCLTHIGTEGRS